MKGEFTLRKKSQKKIKIQIPSLRDLQDKKLKGKPRKIYAAKH